MQVLLELLDQVTYAVDGELTVVELRRLRDSCDSQSIRRATTEIYRGINNPADADNIRDWHRRLIRALEEKISETSEKREQAKIVGIGLGTSVAGGGVLTAISIAVPAVALIPIAGGAYCIWRASENARALSAELTLYTQLKDAAERLIPNHD